MNNNDFNWATWTIMVVWLLGVGFSVWVTWLIIRALLKYLGE